MAGIERPAPDVPPARELVPVQLGSPISTPEQETTAIPTSGLAAPLGAMAYLAVLAYSARVEWRKRDEFMNAFRALLSKAAVKRGYPREKVREDFCRMPNQKINNVLKAAERRIVRWRFPAVRVMNERIKYQSPDIARLMGIAILMDVRRKVAARFGREAAEKVKLTRIVRPSPLLSHTIGRIKLARGSSSEWASIIADWPAYHDTVKDFKKREWRTTRPVLDLAMALHGVCLEREAFDLVDLVIRPDWLPKALRQADWLGRYLVDYHGFDAAEFVRLVPDNR